MIINRIKLTTPNGYLSHLKRRHVKGKLRGRITIASPNRTDIAREATGNHAARLPFLGP